MDRVEEGLWREQALVYMCVHYGLDAVEKSGYLRSEFCMDSFLGTKGVRLDAVLLSVRRNED